MKKLIIFVLMLIGFLVVSPQDTKAIEKIADNSAQIVSETEVDSERMIQTLAIKNVLAKNKSPFVDSADHFVAIAYEMDIDPYMLPAITGVESGFGRALIPGTHNPFGWGVGRIKFTDWNHGITTVATGLRKSYFNKGAKTVYEVGPRYAGGSTTWAPKVVMYMNAFRAEENRMKRMHVL